MADLEYSPDYNASPTPDELIELLKPEETRPVCVSIIGNLVLLYILRGETKYVVRTWRSAAPTTRKRSNLEI